MVGVLVVGIIGGVISATVFSVIPWSQDQAAKQSVSEAQTAQSLYRAQWNPAGYGTYGDLIEKKLYPETMTVTVDAGTTNGCFVAVAGSTSGRAFWASDQDTTAKQYVPGDTSDCPGVDLASDAAAVIGAASGKPALASLLGFAETLYRSAHGGYATVDQLTHTYVGGRPYLNLPAGSTAAVTLASSSYCAAVSRDDEKTYSWQYPGLATPATVKPLPAVTGGVICPSTTGGPITNLLPNPSAENGMTGWLNWLATSVTPETAVVHGGTTALKVVTPGVQGAEGVAADLPAAPNLAGNHYSAGVWVLAPAGAKMWMFLRTQGAVSADGTRTNFTGTGNWEYITANDRVAQADATKLQVHIRTNGTFQAVTFYVDDAILFQGRNATGYSDGNSPGWVWNGTANASTSTGP